MFCFVVRSAALGDVADQARVLVEQQEQRRIALIERVTPCVVCVYDSSQGSSGTGFLIDRDGLGLTNYHVVRKMLNTRHGLGGLSDGTLYDLEVLGIDPTGDVAMFRLLGKDDGVFPFCELGDSDAMRVGDTAMAMGNPFSLSEDYTPTVTLGMVTGMHRYQKGSGKNLIYSDCIQIDAPINPGNSGGPLFNGDGLIVGINGRISVSMRGRLNVGFGYAIASNQIKRFIPSLRAGLTARHGTLQATVEDAPGGEVVFSQVKPGASADRAGVRVGDRLVALDGIAIGSANHFGSVMGTYPARWPVVLDLMRQGASLELLARLDAIPPSLSNPFKVDPDVNMAEVQRVLRRFGNAVFGTPGKMLTEREGSEKRVVRRPPKKWTVLRRFDAVADGSGPRVERFDVEMPGDGPILMRQRYEDGSLGRLIEYDDRSAGWRRMKEQDGAAKPAVVPDGGSQERPTAGEHTEGESFESSLEDQLVLNALYVFQRRLCTPVEALDLTGVRHVGGDRRLLNHGGGGEAIGRLDGADTKTHPRTARRDSPIAWQLLEVVEWPLGEHRSARLSFDTKSFRLVRIDVRDNPSDTEIAIELLDYTDIGGLIWPGTMVVRGGGLRYRDELSGWEIAR